MNPAGKVDGRKRRGTMTREIIYQKVVLAVYALADAEGLACDTTTAKIAAECGHSIEAVRRSVDMMVERGVVRSIDSRHGLNRRIFVLTDHPGAGDFIERTLAGTGPKGEPWLREWKERRRRQGRATEP